MKFEQFFDRFVVPFCLGLALMVILNILTKTDCYHCNSGQCSCCRVPGTTNPGRDPETVRPPHGFLGRH